MSSNTAAIHEPRSRATASQFIFMLLPRVLFYFLLFPIPLISTTTFPFFSVSD